MRRYPERIRLANVPKHHLDALMAGLPHDSPLGSLARAALFTKPPRNEGAAECVDLETDRTDI
jgi:hypothetical protein